MPQDQYGNYLLPSGGIGATVVPITPKQFRLNADGATQAAFDAADTEMQKFKSFMMRYPPPRVSPKGGRPYARTEELLISWRTTRQRGVSTDVYNIARYAHFVHGDNHGNGQLDYHFQTGWPNMYREFQKRKPVILQAAQTAFMAAL